MRCALIGCGRIGYEFDKDPKRTGANTHAGAYHAYEKATFVGVCDHDKAKRDACAALFECDAFADVNTLLNEGLDVVSIAVPEVYHEAVLLEVLEHAKCPKIIWMEKPFIGKLEPARKLVALAESKGVHINVNYQRRWCGLYRTLQTYGTPLGGTVYFARGILNTASHFIDLLVALYGSPKSVHTMDLPCFTLAYDNFAINFMTIEADYNLTLVQLAYKDQLVTIPPSTDVLEIQGCVASEHFSEHRDLGPVTKLPTKLDPMIEQVEHFAQCLETGKFEGLNNGIGALKVLDKIV